MNRLFTFIAATVFLAAGFIQASSSAQIAGQVNRRGGIGIPEPVAPARPIGPPPVTDPNTVILTVSVTGKDNASVAGLGKDRFQVFEDGVEQQISYFWEDSSPITVGFVFDDSDRMGTNDKIDVLKEAAQSFLKNKNPADEYFLTRLSGLANIAVSFTTDVSLLPMAYSFSGETALYDGVHVALDVIKESANSRKILLVITSGGDRCRPALSTPEGQNSCSNDNRTTSQEVLEAYALKQPVQIYTIFVVDDIADVDSEFVHRHATALTDLATWTGGRMHNAINSARAVEAVCAEIARGLKTQYLVGYKSTNTALDGKRRGVKVKVNPSEGSPKLSVWTKSGYYTLKEN